MNATQTPRSTLPLFGLTLGLSTVIGLAACGSDGSGGGSIDEPPPNCPSGNCGKDQSGSGCGWVGAAFAPVLCLLFNLCSSAGSPKSPARQTPVRFGSVGSNSAAAGCVSISPQERESLKRPHDPKRQKRRGRVPPLGAPAARGSPWTQEGRWSSSSRGSPES